MGQNFNLDLCHLHILLIYSFPKISIGDKNKQERQHQDEKYYGKIFPGKFKGFLLHLIF